VTQCHIPEDLSPQAPKDYLMGQAVCGTWFQSYPGLPALILFIPHQSKTQLLLGCSPVG